MQLRPRDGNGRAITNKDGLIRSFKKIIDRDQLDPMPEVPVRGGEMYYFKTAKSAGPKGEDVVKMVKYDPTVAKEKKVPKFKSNYNKVEKLVLDAKTSGTSGSVDYKSIRQIKSLYVDTLKVIDDKQFQKMLKEHDIIEKVEEGDNTTDHADLKKFVEEAITEYRSVHPNRPIKLSDGQYQSFINKVLMRVREQYYVNAAQITFSSNDSKENSVYTYYTAGALHDNSLVGLDELTELSSSYSSDINKLNKERKIINVTAGTDLSTLNTKEITGQDWKTSKLQIFSPLTQINTELSALKDLIEELYKIFVEQTKQQLKNNPVMGFQFSDGGGKRGSRVRRGSKRENHHAKAKAKPKSKAAKALAKAKAKAKADGSRRR